MAMGTKKTAGGKLEPLHDSHDDAPAVVKPTNQPRLCVVGKSLLH